VGSPSHPRFWLVVDAEAITNLDYTAARVVLELNQELTERGVTLAFARVGPYLQADFDRHHISQVIGADRVFARLHDAVAAFAKLGQALPVPRRTEEVV
jgi:MFS superfamily sulfate permease-like transporter